MTPGLSGLGKIRGHFIISEGGSVMVSEQMAMFGSASFQENGSNLNT